MRTPISLALLAATPALAAGVDLRLSIPERVTTIEEWPLARRVEG